MVSVGVVRAFHAEEAAGQDGFTFRAVTVWPDGVEPELARPEPRPNNVGYRSSLTITFDDPAERA